MEDNLGCLAVDSFEVLSLSHLTSSVDSVVDVLCHGDTTGFVSVSAENGVPPYLYNWSNAAFTPSQFVMAGMYVSTITDDLGGLHRD